MDANKVLRKYAAGERNFRPPDSTGVSLIKANLRKADFTRTNVDWVNLKIAPTS
jgi:uncharacterized protein YjbI with pentapeptide repeats